MYVVFLPRATYLSFSHTKLHRITDAFRSGSTQQLDCIGKNLHLLARFLHEIHTNTCYLSLNGDRFSLVQAE